MTLMLIFVGFEEFWAQEGLSLHRQERSTASPDDSSTGLTAGFRDPLQSV